MKNRLFFIPPFVIIIALFIVGTFLDLNISSSIVQAGNHLSAFFSGFVSVPIFFGLTFASGAFIKLAIIRYKKLKHRIFTAIFVLFTTALSILIGGKNFASYEAYQLSTTFSILVGVIITIPGLICGFFFYKCIDSPNLIKVCALIVISVIITYVFAFGIKYSVSRVRYIFLVETSLDFYRPWYSPNLSPEIIEVIKAINKDGIKSFPSGHSNFAMCVAFMLMYLPRINNKLMKYQGLLSIIGFIYFFFIAFTRIFAGMHYLSDTMMSGFISLFVYFIANEIYMRKLNNEDKKNNA